LRDVFLTASIYFYAEMEAGKIKKIVVVGPESTGKSTLCQQLAEHFHTIWCPEYAREYLLKHGMDYSYDDLLTIAKGQIKLEEDCEAQVRKSESPKDRKTGGPKDIKNLSNDWGITSGLPDFRTSRLLFVDTNMYVMKVWCDFVFGKCHEYILDQIKKRQYDLYLLCNVDLPWVKDELREYPDLVTRERLYYIYKEIMVNQPVPWVDISGNYDERLKKAIAATQALLSN